MKRIILPVLLFLISAGAFSQISITQQQMPKAKDTFYYNLGTPTQYGALLNLTGAGKVWILPADSIGSSVVEYKNSSGTPYSGSFINMTGLKIADSLGFGQFMMEDVYQFYAGSTASFRVKGMGFRISMFPLPLAGNYTDEDEMYFLPLTYGKRDSSTFKLKVNIPLLGSYSQVGYRITEVSGHGKLIMPYDTFDVLQVKSTIVGADSVTFQSNTFGFPTTRIEYRWLCKQFRAPLLEITGTEAAGNFVPAQARYMRFNGRATTKDTTDTTGHGTNSSFCCGISNKAMVFPNPFRESLGTSGDYTSLQIMDVMGRPVLHSENKAVIDTQLLLPGIYIVRFYFADGREEVQRIIRQQ